MTDKEYVLTTMRRYGRLAAEDLQARAPEMTGTEIIAEEEFIPDFDSTRQYLNYPAGYLCRSEIGNVVKLIQPYDSITYPQQPEKLESQWGFYWSTDPKKAKPFVSKATSPFNTGDCCVYEGHVWRSGQDGNTWAPGTLNIKWEDLGTVEEIMGAA